MKLISFHVSNYKSVLDSNPINVDQITCLVGKNEAGKTALLRALCKLNSLRPEDANFNVTDDFPRMDVADYEDDIAKGKRQHAVAISASYKLEQPEITEVESVFGPDFLKSDLTIEKKYDNSRSFILKVDEKAAIKFLTRAFSTELQSTTSACLNADQLLEALESHTADPAVAAIIELVRKCKGHNFGWYAFNQIVKKYEPKFLYFDEYYQMSGCENIETLQQRVNDQKLLPSDQPLLGLIELARLNLPDLLNPSRTQDLKNKLQGAGNHLTKQILPYWSQNKHLQMQFDVRKALPGDPPGMQSGTNIWAEVYDNRHFATTGLGTRSRGFVWFFSFVAWYSQVRRNEQKIILLLDEPGLTLHGRAQGDLLRYFEKELKPHHQLIYSTHSPFMVDAGQFERVRIVQDLSIEVDDLPREKQGTKVTTNVLDATDDSLFPLQGALGYEIQQTLFIGANTLLIEGASDFLYIQTMSGVLQREGREGLSEKWTLAPVGGSSRISNFVRLLVGQRNMKIATLIDVQSKDRPIVESLYKDKLLKKANVRTFADYTGTKEADIEDMFDQNLYVKLLNDEFKKELGKPLDSKMLASKAPRILVRLEEYLESHPLKSGTFSHYRPARRFAESIATYETSISPEAKDRFESAFRDLNALL